MESHARSHRVGEYSFWIHFAMATCIGCAMFVVGLFIYWRVQVVHDVTARVESVLQSVSDRQDEGLRLLRQLKR